MKVGGEPRIVEGVLPKNFVFPVMNGMPTAAHPGDVPPYEIFQPLVPQPDDLTADDSDFAFLVVARLKPGVTALEAGSELDGMQKSYSAGNHLSIHLGAIVEPLSHVVTGNVSKALWLLLGAVSGVLLIACVNLASLQLARSVAREHENALRAALGARPSSALSSIAEREPGGFSDRWAYWSIRCFRWCSPLRCSRAVKSSTIG